MKAFNRSPENDKLAVFIVEPGKVGSLISDGTAGAWNYDLSDPKWNRTETEYMTVGNSTFGVHAGKSEPGQCLYFNKRVLEEAGISWEDIYDMQANGTWTWEAFTGMLGQITRDTDNDGMNDIYGIVGSGDDMYVSAVFSNGGSFFDFDENGDLIPTMGSDAAIEAMAWGKEIQANYWAPTPEGANWDWYKSAWKQGYCGFYMYQAYGGFNDNSEMSDMEDEWGCVAFPVPNEGDNYVTVVSDNITMIPGCYDAVTSNRIAFIYDMWTMPVPGYPEDDEWIGNKYNFTDERAVDETYAMLREPEHTVVNRVGLIGTQNDVIGFSLLWKLGSSTPEEAVENGMAAWELQCADFNEKTADVRIPDLSRFTKIVIPASVTTVSSEAFYGTGAQVIIIPEACENVAIDAFDGCIELKFIVNYSNLTIIPPENVRVIKMENRD